jgi:hypothetical protein
MRVSVLLILVFSLFLMSGVSANLDGEKENVDFVPKRDKEVVQVKSVAQEQAEIISEMRDEVKELHYMTCQITRMLKGTGDNKDVRRDCKPRDNRGSQPTTRSGDTHRGGNGFDLTTSSER